MNMDGKKGSSQIRIKTLLNDQKRKSREQFNQDNKTRLLGAFSETVYPWHKENTHEKNSKQIMKTILTSANRILHQSGEMVQDSFLEHQQPNTVMSSLLVNQLPDSNASGEMMAGSS